MIHQLQRLLAWTSPSFPIGAFSYSGGLEAAIEAGIVTDLESLKAWLDSQRTHGRLHMDAWYLREALEGGNIAGLSTQCLAQNSAKQLRDEAEALGTAMARTLNDAWGHDLKPGAYPVVFGAACRAEAIDAETALNAFAHAYVANQISVACRVIPLGQTDGQRCLFDQEPKIKAAVKDWLKMQRPPFTAILAADLLAQAHETQYSRMFRS